MTDRDAKEGAGIGTAFGDRIIHYTIAGSDNVINIPTGIADTSFDNLFQVQDYIRKYATNYRRTALVYVIFLTLAIISLVATFLLYSDVSFSLEQQNFAAAIGGVILRVGSVVLVVYLAQILVSFSRYHYRVADKMFSQANALLIVIGIGNLDKLPDVVGSLSLDNIEFGKMPKSPSDKIIDTLSESISKLSSKV